MATLKKILTLGCIINTIFITCFYLLAAFLPGFDWIPSLGTMFMILGFSFVISGAERVLSVPFSMTGRVLLHYALCLGGFMILYTIGNEKSDSGAQVLIAAVFFTFIYIIVNIARFIVMARKARIANEKLDYAPSFKK